MAVTKESTTKNSTRPNEVEAKEQSNTPKPVTKRVEKNKVLLKSEGKKAEPKTDLAKTFRVGYTVKVNYKIIEGGKERIQPFEGIVISKKGKGVSKTFTVRRIGAKNIGVERIFPIYSPKISSIDVIKIGVARRAKLYYLRQKRSKKDSKIKEKVQA